MLSYEGGILTVDVALKGEMTMNLKRLFTLLITVLCLFVTGCLENEPEPELKAVAKRVSHISPPAGYIALSYDDGSFSKFVQNLPLKKGTEIVTHKGRKVNSFYNVLAVIELPLLFRGDLEQCADYAMRLWAEYYKESEDLKSLYLFNYDGSKSYYSKAGQSYKDFLFNRFNYSNSHSIKFGGKRIEKSELRPGDLIVQNEKGGIGHVSVIFNICRNEKGEKLYLIGYSFMPAQEMHIEGASAGEGKEGWFTLEGYYRYLEEKLPLGAPHLRRF